MSKYHVKQILQDVGQANRQTYMIIRWSQYFAILPGASITVTNHTKYYLKFVSARMNVGVYESPKNTQKGA